MTQSPTPQPDATPEDTARRLLELEQEREVSGTTSTDSAHLAEARAALHAWVDSAVAVVAIPGAGRVSLIHADGTASQIVSAAMAYRLSPKVTFKPEG